MGLDILAGALHKGAHAGNGVLHPRRSISRRGRARSHVTRFDFYDVGLAPGWGALVAESAGPWTFEDASDDAGQCLLKAHADGSGAEVRIMGEGERDEEQGSLEWLRARIDRIQHALVTDDFDTVLAFLQSLPLDPAPDHAAPPPVVETVAFATALAAIEAERLA